MDTPITRLLGIETPIVCAPMGDAAGGELAGTVSAAGGFGFIGAVFANHIDLDREIALAKKKVEKLPKRPDGMLPFGVGVITFGEVAFDAKEPDKWPLLDIALENKVAALWFSFGDASPLIPYVRKKSPGTIIFAQVQHVHEALRAVEEWKVDGLVVQGIESGGHGAVESMTTFTLLPTVIAELEKRALRVPILAAGGVVTGNQLVSALSLGAHGVVVGTGFLATPECKWPVHYKQAVVDAKDGNSTIRTDIWDLIWDWGWPKEVNGRVLKNEVAKIRNPSPEELTRLREEYQKAREVKDLTKLPLWCGQGVGLINDITSAAEIVKKMTSDALARIDKLATVKLIAKL